MSTGRLSVFHQARLLCLPQTVATQSHGTSSGSSTSACQNSASRHPSSGSLGSGSRFIKASPGQALLWGGPYSGWAAPCPPALMTSSMRLGLPCPEPDHPFCPPTPAPVDGRKRGDSAGLGETTHHGTQAWEEEAWESSHDPSLGKQCPWDWSRDN